jgi:transcriptional regulator
MYVPRPFVEDRVEVLRAAIRVAGLATLRHEHARAVPWKVSDAPPDYLEGLLDAIVGVELTLTRLEGQWKASQNKGEADRHGVEEGLGKEGNDALADLVRDRGA